MYLEEAILHAKRGEALLFTGAGFSFGTRNMLPDDEGDVPDARGFARRLADKVSAKGQYELPVISQYFVKKKGENGLLDELLQTFTVTAVQSYHAYIGSIPWRRVYTTNYDTSFEFAALQSGLSWHPTTIDAVPSATQRLCVHINGHVSNLTIHTLLKQIKLTHSSYSADSFAESQWSQQFRQDMNAAKAIIFIGYSLADLDISRLIYSSPDLARKSVFIVGPNDDEITVGPLEEHGSVYAIGSEQFVSIAKSITPSKDISPHEYSWLIPYKAPTPVAPTDKEAIELLTMGVAENGNIAWALGEPENSFCVTREVIKQILREIDGGRRWFLLHADLGSGKSILKHELSHFLENRNYKVFWDSSFDLNRKSDLNNIARETDKVSLFIDESPDRFEVIDGLLAVNNPHVVVFICVRSTLYELGEGRYEQYLPADYIPFDINNLTDSDIDQFVRIFNRLGLWGAKARDTDKQKADFVKVECRRGIAKLIVSAFEDSDIGRRITHAASQTLNDKSDVASLIILSFLLNRIGHPPNPTLLSDITDTDAWKIVRTEPFRAAGEFIRFKDGLIKSRSSIISTYLLRKTLRPENLVWHIEQFVRRLARLKRDSVLHHVFVELQRFPVLETIIESSRKREIIIGYFQSIKDIPYNEKRPLFWLHYAMARLAYGEFKESALYFEHAKSLAKDNPKELAEVNNHYARLLLDSRTKSPDYADYFDAFELAHGILLQQMNKGGNKHFPYRQAKNYVEFISFRKRELTDAQVKRFITSCRQVISAIDHLEGSISRSNEVEECRLAMDRAIRIAQMDNDPAPALHS